MSGSARRAFSEVTDLPWEMPVGHLHSLNNGPISKVLGRLASIDHWWIRERVTLLLKATFVWVLVDALSLFFRVANELTNTTPKLASRSCWSAAELNCVRLFWLRLDRYKTEGTALLLWMCHERADPFFEAKLGAALHGNAQLKPVAWGSLLAPIRKFTWLTLLRATCWNGPNIFPVPSGGCI